MKALLLAFGLLVCTTSAALGKEAPVRLRHYVKTAETICICTVTKGNGDGTVTAEVIGSLKGKRKGTVVIRGETGFCVMQGPVSRFMKPGQKHLVFLFKENAVGRLGGILRIDDQDRLIANYIDGFAGTEHDPDKYEHRLPLAEALKQINRILDASKQ